VVALWAWQALLDALGWILARTYDVIPNYGLAIIALTVLTRLVLLPLGIKQIKSMQHMQALQPKLKELQKRFKNNKPKLQEEQMKLYREAGVNPLGGCLPLLLQFPLLFAMYSVIRPIPIVPAPTSTDAAQVFMIEKNHLPEDSDLFHQVITHQGTDLLWMNLQCQLLVAGTPFEQKYSADGEAKTIPPGKPIVGEDGTTPLPGNPTTTSTIDCGSNRFPDLIPYVLLVILMVATTFYTQLQMQRASPPGAQSQQQQTIMRVMPLMFAVFGLQVVSGLVLYWTVSNLFQLGQQTFLLRAGHIGPEAIERRLQEQRQRAAAGSPPKEGLIQRLQRRASEAQRPRGDKVGGANRDQPEGRRPASSKKDPPARAQSPQPPSKSQAQKSQKAEQKAEQKSQQKSQQGRSRSKTARRRAGSGNSPNAPVQGTSKATQAGGEPMGDGSDTSLSTPPSGKSPRKAGRPSIAKPGNQLGRPDVPPPAAPEEGG
jgi:YidC/Oxa1 family membrane protein insertase